MLVFIPLALLLGGLLGAFTVTVLMLLALIASTVWLILAFIYDWNPIWCFVPLITAWLIAWLLHFLEVGSDLSRPVNKASRKSPSQADDDRPAN